jgi:NTP pyrophosphatase (non-canonical NTP hydrolase)
VLFVVLCLANQTGTDLEAAFARRMEAKTQRDHDRHHGNEKLRG